jgi:hypothetical protein
MICVTAFDSTMASNRKIASIESAICLLRGQRVVLDSDLAAIYGVTAKRLNEQLKRNRPRFPDDFAFQLTVQEFTSLKSQIATSSLSGGRRFAVVQASRLWGSQASGTSSAGWKPAGTTARMAVPH